MIKSLESMGAWMLGRLVPAVRASAGCPPEPWCALCGTCYLKRCHITPACKTSCGGCGYDCSALAGGPALALC
jgi:hypothetical protein